VLFFSSLENKSITMRGFQIVVLCCLLGAVDSAPFTTAAAARSKMEELVSKYAADLESMYADMTSDEGAGCTGKYVSSCDSGSSKWGEATSLAQFNNPGTGTCTRFDMDEKNDFLSTPRTGRVSACSANPSQCKSPQSTVDCSKGDMDGIYSAQYNALCKCHYNIVTHNFLLHASGAGGLQSKADYLDTTGCVSAADTTKCTVNLDEMGINHPANTGPHDQRVCSEIVATSMLQADFQANAALHDDISWTFMGLQETGLYRTWPAIYQCRTENQCSGCSDPRFRNWYAEAASGPKDVVLVLDTSGSMSEAGRFALMQKAAKWVTNTLTKYDTATIVDFATHAKMMDFGGEGGTKLQQMDDVGRAKMKEYIDGLSVFGNTNMPDAFEKAFDVLEASHAARGGSGCGLKQSVILFLTDGVNSADSSPIEVVTRRNSADFNARVFTYSLGADTGGSDSMMQALACQSNGVWSKVGDGDDLEKTMAQYFMYLSAGIAIEAATVRWSDWYEDGQGLGQVMAACSPVYDRAQTAAAGVSIMFGVICTSIHKDRWTSYPDAAATMSAIETQDALCPSLNLSPDQMEIIRSRFENGKSCKASTSEAETVIGAAVGGVVGVVVLAIAAWYLCRKGGSKTGTPQPGQTMPQNGHSPVLRRVGDASAGGDGACVRVLPSTC
jgi:uncharacterized protein YegL